VVLLVFCLFILAMVDLVSQCHSHAGGWNVTRRLCL